MFAVDHDDPRVQVALRLIGTRYHYGRGAPKDAHIGDAACLAQPTDCSGSAQEYAVVVGDIDSSQPDRNAHALAMVCDPVSLEDARCGDLVFYDRNTDGRMEHVAIYIGGGMVVSMSGGSQYTFGDDPNACGQVRPIGAHRVIGRWKASVRRGP